MSTDPIKAIIERNYFESGKVCFFEACPARLQNLIDPAVVVETVSRINQILSKMTDYGGKHILENIASTASFYTANSILPHSSKEALDEMSKFIAHQNGTIFREKGLELRNPVECGMLQLEFHINA